MKNEIVFASNNVGKIKELTTMLEPLHYSLVPQAQLNILGIEETGLTFIENAILKARHACHQSGKPAIADDSGLVVPALNGAPGIYSARYAGKNSNAHANIVKLLADMQSFPEKKRAAYFYCCLIYLKHAEDPTPLIGEGTWHGTILQSPTGSHGFGYDPIFYDPHEKFSAAELTLEKKNRISHRGKALTILIEQLKK